MLKTKPPQAPSTKAHLQTQRTVVIDAQSEPFVVRALSQEPCLAAASAPSAREQQVSAFNTRVGKQAPVFERCTQKSSYGFPPSAVLLWPFFARIRVSGPFDPMVDPKSCHGDTRHHDDLFRECLGN
ncbi:MAG: hypothetical protein AB3X44_09855 [Leptothrix sp. (in: b-proteobacteria)]